MPTFTTSIKMLAATEHDYVKVSQKMISKSWHPDGPPPSSQTTSEASHVHFRSGPKASLLDATTEVSMAVSSIGKKFSFTIMKEK